MSPPVRIRLDLTPDDLGLIIDGLTRLASSDAELLAACLRLDRDLARHRPVIPPESPPAGSLLDTHYRAQARSEGRPPWADHRRVS